MFYVYYMNDGCMLTPKTSGIGGRVLDLQYSIQDITHVDVLDQVLYLSNGEQVHGDSALSNYVHVGTETTPFYMLKRTTHYNSESYLAKLPERNDIVERNIAWKKQLQAMERTSNACIADILRIWKYGQQLNECVYRTCSKYVVDHRYLYQGWQAMIKNLMESTARMAKFVERSSHNAECLSSLRERGLADLEDFDSVLKTLTKIIVPGQLLNPKFRNSQANSTSSLSSSAVSSATTTPGSEEMSLYDWIASTDQSYSPDEMVTYLLDDLQNTNDVELHIANEHIAFVNAILVDSKHRDIGGVNQRISTIENRLRQMEERYYQLVEMSDQMLKEVATTAIPYHRRRLADFAQLLGEMINHSTSIINSKEELMRNITSRVSNWIQRCYERLNLARKCLMIFDGKFNGLRDRLKLVRQIREAPILYMTAVAEAIRRETLRKEFNEWYTVFTERCSKFINDENKLRNDFYSKLGEHFLRNIFYNLSDQMPDFRPHCPPFDRLLPRVAIAHLRELRKNFPNMHELLNVTRPCVFERLAVANAPLSSPVQQTANNNESDANASRTEPVQNQFSLKREESFFVGEQTTNIKTINECFPSTNWLSEEHIDMSPSNQFFITTNPNAHLRDSNSQNSLQVETLPLASPAELGPLSDLSSTIEKNNQSIRSHPISINAYRNSTSDLCDSKGSPIILDVSSSYTLNETLNSKRNSPFGTPDSTFNVSARPTNLIPNNVENSNKNNGLLDASMEICSPSSENKSIELNHKRLVEFHREIVALSAFFNELRESTALVQRKLREWREDDATNIRNYLDKFQAFHQLEIAGLKERLRKNADERVSTIHIEFERRNNELNNAIEHERQLREKSENEVEEQKLMIQKINENLFAVIKAKNDLHGDLQRVEQERLRLKEQMEAETSIDYLQIKLKSVGQFIKRELTDEEVEEIKREIEKCKISSKSDENSLNSESMIISPPSSSSMNTYVESLAVDQSKKRNEYEKAFRSKMELIVHGIEEKKNKELKAQRENIEQKMRNQNEAITKRLKERIAELELHLQKYENQKTINTIEHVVTENSNVPLDTCKMDDSTILTFPSGQKTNEIKDKNAISFASNNEIILEERADSTDIDSSIKSLTKSAILTQTRIRSRDMDYMISLKNIHEGCSVLIMWNSVYNAYIIFCTSSILYIVREHSINRMNIRSNDPLKRRSWLFVIVENMDFCQIRKAENRYNLPVNTRFYWVTVSPLPLDLPNGSSTPIVNDVGSSQMKLADIKEASPKIETGEK